MHQKMSYNNELLYSQIVRFGTRRLKPDRPLSVDGRPELSNQSSGQGNL